MIINIEGLDKAKVLLELYNNARCQGEAFAGKGGLIMPVDGEINLAIEKMKEIEEQITSAEYTHVDYINLGSGSLPIKTIFTRTTIEVTDYDYYHGEGLAETLITKLRADSTLNVDESPKESIKKIMALLKEHYASFNSESDEDNSDYSFSKENEYYNSSNDECNDELSDESNDELSDESNDELSDESKDECYKNEEEYKPQSLCTLI